jgi:uncharacterized protein (TIGR03435 family)
VKVKLLLAPAGIPFVTAAVVMSSACVASIQAQPPASTPPQFEVASVKLSRNPEPGGDVQVTPGRFRGKDLALQWLILVAYRLKSGKLSGDLPDWTISERYDIDAKTGDASGEDRVLLALQALLRDRFQLKAHSEMRDEPVYFLTIGKNGIKMPPGSCVPQKQDLPNECYSSTSEGLVQTMDWRGVPMSAPAGVAYRSLAGHLTVNGRPVIDKTGLTGTFDVHLRWARDPDPPAAGAAPSQPLDANAPSIFDAVQEQLGLKLEAGRGPVEYMVVDHVQKPGGN